MAAGFRKFTHKIITGDKQETSQSHRRTNSDPMDAQEFYNEISANIDNRQFSNRHERSLPYDSHSKIKHGASNQSSNVDRAHNHQNTTTTRRHQNHVYRSQSWYESDKDKVKILKRQHQLKDDSRQALDDVRSMLTELNDEIQNGFNRITFTQVMDAMISELRNCLQLCQEEYNRGSNQFANAINENQRQKSNQDIADKPIDSIYRITKPQKLSTAQALYPYDFLHNSNDNIDTTEKYHQQGSYNNAKRRHSLPEYSSIQTIDLNDEVENLRSNQSNATQYQAGSSIQESADTGYTHNRLDHAIAAKISHANQYVIPDIKKSRNDLIKEVTLLREKLEISTSRLKEMQSQYMVIKSQNDNLKSMPHKDNIASNHRRYSISLHYNFNLIFFKAIL